MRCDTTRIRRIHGSNLGIGYFRYVYQFIQSNDPRKVSVANIPELWSKVPIAKLTIAHLIKKFLVFYGTRRFITVFARTRHRTLFPDCWIQSATSHSIYSRWKHIIIPSTNRSLRWSFSFRYSDQHFAQISHLMRSTCPFTSFSLIWSLLIIFDRVHVIKVLIM
jgi:hypothetical protein